MNPVIRKTNKFDLFGFYDHNRNINLQHVEELKKSMIKHGFLATKPIEVDYNKRIREGQHRFTAAKELNIPFYYVEKDGGEANIDILIDMQISKKWNSDDYCKYYKTKGLVPYQALDAFAKKHNLPLTVALAALVNDNTKTYKQFRDGELVLGSIEIAEKIIKTSDLINELTNGEFKQVRTRSFIRALKALISHPKYIEEIFIDKLVLLSQRIKNMPSIQEYKTLLEGIYNYRLQVGRIKLN